MSISQCPCTTPAVHQSGQRPHSGKPMREGGRDGRAHAALPRFADSCAVDWCVMK